MKNKKIKNVTKFNNIKEIIYNSIKLYGDRIAFTIKHIEELNEVYEDKTYKQFLKEVNSLGTMFYKMGLKNKRIAIVGRNKYEWALSCFAALLGGIVMVPLDKDLQIEELESSLSRSKADIIIFDEKYIDKINPIKERNNTSLKEYISMEKTENYKSVWELIESGKKLLDNKDDSFINAKIKDEELAILLFTSGTTSQSKAVMLSQSNVANNVYSMQLVEDIRETDTNIAFLPFHHIFGCTGLIVMLSCGVRTVFSDGLRHIAKNFKEYKVSIFVGVPILLDAIYQNVLKEIEKQGKTKTIKIAIALCNALHLSNKIRRKIFKQVIDGLGGNMRFLISGGAPLDKETSKWFNSIGITLVQGYGLTETAPVIAAENNNKIKSGSVGKLMENVSIDFINKDEKGIGEIVVKGPNVMLGYYENEEATKEVLKDGWFNTGDLGYMDKDGFLYITGRKKNLIVLKNGKKIFPEELETLINRLELVKECMVFGLPKKDDVLLSVKVVYDELIALGKSKEELAKTIWNQIKELNKTLPHYKYIKNMVITDEELIKTTTKKIKRNEEMNKILKTI